MSDSTNPPHWLLRRSDQIAVAAAIVATLMLLTGWWFFHGGYQNRLIEIDQADSRTVRFEVDINAADAQELTQLPGIGPKLAERIVASRETDGPFIELEDLRRVRGIGPKTLEHLYPFLRPMVEGGKATVDKKTSN